MGGDKGPRVAVHGARLALSASARTSAFILHGRREELDPLLDEFPDLKAVSTDRPLRQRHHHGRKAHRRRSGAAAAIPRCGRRIQSVKDGEADVAISGGNTGALMAMSTLCLRPIEGHRPPRDRRHLAVDARRDHRPRRRRHRRQRRQAARRFLDPRRRAGPRAVRSGVADRRPAQRRHRGDEGHRVGKGGRARARPPRAAPASPTTASSRATTSARAPSMSSSPTASPATSR